MVILFTGAPSGGHFYPLIAVAEEMVRISREKHLVSPKMYYASTSVPDQSALDTYEISFKKINAGKIRRYFSFKNFTDVFVTFWGSVQSLWMLLTLYPDAVFSKGGYASVPVVFAAKILGIPVIIHESDAKPGRANLFSAKFADEIAVSFPDSITYFPEKHRGKIAHTGTPIRRDLQQLQEEGARELVGIPDDGMPILLVLTGSLGSRAINETVIDGLPQLLDTAHVIHQTGKELSGEAQARSSVVIADHPHKDRYHPHAFLSVNALKQAAAAANLIVSRAGASAISEFALWGKPAILIPIPEDVSHDQRTNALMYADTGAAVMLDQSNVTPSILAAQVHQILTDPTQQTRMRDAALGFAQPDAATIIAQELITIGLKHES